MKRLIYIFLLLSLFACNNEKTSNLQVQLINADLNKGITSGKDLNKVRYKHLRYKVKKGGNSKEGQERVYRAKELEKDIEGILSYIEKVEKENSKNNFTLKKGEKLKRKLDEFINTLYKKNTDLGFNKEDNNFPLLLELPKSLFKNNESFTETHFKNSGKKEIENILVEAKYKLLIYQSKILKFLGADDLANGMHISHNGILINTNKNITKLGDTYKANMMLGTTVKNKRFKTYLNDKPIPFKGLYDKKERTEYVEINLPTYTKGVFTLKAEFSYTIWQEEKYEYKDTTFYITKKYKVIP